MPTCTVQEAQANLSALIERAEAGEEVIIVRGDVPAVRLAPVMATRAKRRFGAYKGKATLTDAFFEPLPEEELAAWE